MTISTERRGLGRGLGELFQRTDLAPPNGAAETAATDPPTPAPTVGGASFAELPLSAITPNPRQPRVVFDEEAMAELVASIGEVGLLQPVVVRPTGRDRSPPGWTPTPVMYELVMGERRWRAAQQAGLATIPAIVRETGDDQLLRDALLENLHRAQLNPLEEAAAYQQMLEDFGCTQDELAARIKRSRPHISNTLRLLKLPPTVQRRVAAGVLSAGHARALLTLDDPAGQERLAQRVVAEGISVRTLEELVTLGEGSTEPRPRRIRSPQGPIRAPSMPPAGSRIGWRLGCGSRWDRRRGRSASSSPRSTTWSASLVRSRPESTCRHNLPPIPARSRTRARTRLT